MGFLGRGFKSRHPQYLTFLDFPHVELENYSPRYPQETKPLGYRQVRPYNIRPICYPAVSGGESVIWLSLGKLLVNLLQVVKRTNTPLIP